MSKLIDLTGQKFGKLTVIERVGTYITPRGAKTPLWKCKCDCGEECIVRRNDLRSGAQKSCGCYLKELTSKMSKKHGMSSSHVNAIWRGIKDRCYNPNNKSYKNYGGRGITVDTRWIDKEKGFINFYYDVSKLPHFGEKGYSLDRINNNGNYEIDNVRWANREEQNNNKRNNRFIEYNGKKQTISQWGRELGISESLIKQRLDNLDWTVDNALTTPVKKYKKGKKQ